jgi:hypothetical protein
MSIRLQPRDDDGPQDGGASGSAATESSMSVDDLQQPADVQPTVMLDRRLRNWLLFGNVVLWILIVAVVRWLFF